MDPSKMIIITNDMSATLFDTQLNTYILLKTIDNGVPSYIKMKIDRWSEFKQSIRAIDQEFWKRFNYQYPNL